MSLTRVYWLHTLSSTHVGTGRGLGYIDLPIHREKLTNWPVIPGSAFKGVWSDSFRGASSGVDKELDAAFGKPNDQDGDSLAGSLVPTDARLVALPIRSFTGTFAWCTSPTVLRMLRRDLSLAGIPNLPNAPHDLQAEVVHVAGDSLWNNENRVILEDLDFGRVACQTAHAWADLIAANVFPEEQDGSWRDGFRRRFVVVSDGVFDFLSTTGTEVVTRVRINDDSKTVIKGALWTEESVPAETIFAGTIMCDRVYGKDPGLTQERLVDRFATTAQVLQIGGKASVGRGRVQVRFTAQGAN